MAALADREAHEAQFVDVAADGGLRDTDAALTEAFDQFTWVLTLSRAMMS